MIIASLHDRNLDNWVASPVDRQPGGRPARRIPSPVVGQPGAFCVILPSNIHVGRMCFSDGVVRGVRLPFDHDFLFNASMNLTIGQLKLFPIYPVNMEQPQKVGTRLKSGKLESRGKHSFAAKADGLEPNLQK